MRPPYRANKLRLPARRGAAFRAHSPPTICLTRGVFRVVSRGFLNV